MTSANTLSVPLVLPAQAHIVFKTDAVSIQNSTGCTTDSSLWLARVNKLHCDCME